MQRNERGADLNGFRISSASRLLHSSEEMSEVVRDKMDRL